MLFLFLQYKEALLGAAASGKVVSPKDDPRRVVIVKMRVMFEDRPDGHIEYDLDTKEKLEAMKDKPVREQNAQTPHAQEERMTYT
jgi:hypothetical protein